MTAHDVLVGVRNLIADERKWGQGARLPAGVRCVGIALADVAFVLGVSDGERDRAWEALRVAAPCACVGCWNDSSSHATVLAGVDRAVGATAPAPDVSFLGVVA